MDIMNYVKPELIVVAAVVYFLGLGIKKSQTIKDKYIPFINGGVAVVLCGLWVFATSNFSSGQDIAMGLFVGITQGILMAGLSTYADQLVKQARKGE